MYTATELIDALRRRSRRSLRPDRPAGEFPSGWAAWFAAMRERVGAVTGATADAIVAIFLQRELARPAPRSGQLNRWQAFATLWRQDWHPPLAESRRERIAALVITFAIHIILALLLLWLAYVRFVGGPAAPQGEEIVQVEYIGEGTPDAEGGGTPSGPVPEPRQAPGEAAPTAAATGTPPPPSATSAAQPEVPVPQPVQQPEPEAAQPLVVTEVAQPDSAFVLPPANARPLQVQAPTLSTPDVREAVREIEMPRPQPTPQVRVLQPRQTTTTVQAPELSERVTEIPMSDIPTRLPATRARSAAAANASLPDATVREGVREIAMPARQPGSGQQASTQPAGAGARTGSAPETGGPPRPGTGASTASTSGAGPKPAATPGAWATPQRGDDWGNSNRNRPGGNTGGKPGVFNADGSVRLPSTVAGTSGGDTGFPPGSDDWTRAKLDRAGTWLKRPPSNYRGTRFDEYWIPNGTLLEEWVRRGIKKLSIPVPGTSKKIECVVSILQLGGGCGVADPDQDVQPSLGTPAPDIPFKPELQEDQDSLRKPGQP